MGSKEFVDHHTHRNRMIITKIISFYRIAAIYELPSGYRIHSASGVFFLLLNFPKTEDGHSQNLSNAPFDGFFRLRNRA